MRRVLTVSIRRATSPLVAIATAATASLALAIPANASVNMGTVTIASGVLSGNNLTGNISDGFWTSTSEANGTYVIFDVSGSGGGSATKGGVSCATGCLVGNSLGTNWVVTRLGNLRVEYGTGGGLVGFITITAPSNGESTPAPAPIIQQFGKPTSGTCASAAPADLNWSNVSSGGWGESWAQWMNSSNGGAVCTRMLVYSTAQSKWMLG